MKGKPVPLELRNKIITSIVEDGVPVSTLASEYISQRVQYQYKNNLHLAQS
jgi:hypothetical protein